MKTASQGISLVALAAAAACSIEFSILPRGPDADAAVRLSALRADWSTPNTIRWEWVRQGDLSQLSGVELVVAQSAEDVAARSGTAKVWTRADNAELGVAFLTSHGEEDPVLATLVDGLTPSTTYWAQLEAVDLAGRRSASNVASYSTAAPPTGEIVIFGDAATPGYTIPDSFRIGTADPYRGTHDYEFVPECAGLLDCFENLRWHDLGIDTAAVPQSAYETTAFVELALQNRGGPSLWSQMRLWFNGCAGSTALSDAMTIQGGNAYRVYQLPLRAFTFGTQSPPPYSAFLTGLCELCVGAHLSEQGLVLVDEVRIRW